jgi:5-methylcytosine-specific restriction endonuclease McrA
MKLQNLSEEGMVKAVWFATANGYVPVEITVKVLSRFDYAFSGPFVRSFRPQIRRGDPLACLCRLNFRNKTFTAVVFRKLSITSGLKGQLRKITQDLRYQVFIRDSYTCQVCGSVGARNGGNEIPLHVDHVIPINAGGSDRIENLQTLCYRCNLKKSDKLTFTQDVKDRYLQLFEGGNYYG